MRLWLPISISILPALSLTTVFAGGGSEDPATALTPESSFPREEPFVTRSFHPVSGDRWIGNGIAYGPYRDGQHPGGPVPSKAEVGQDLHLMSKHWGLIRLYSATGPSETVLEVIRTDGLDIKVMLGVWIDAEGRPGENGKSLESLPDVRAANRREIASAIRLAADYPDIVVALCVGNETQVSWSSHRVPPDLLIGYVREVRAQVRVPVTVADDFNFWNKPESHVVARELDFLVMHAHPLWNGILLENALEWTRKTFAEVRAAHPDLTVILGETGWATRKHDEGEQADLIKGHPGEEEQKVFYEAIAAWSLVERIPTFFFEAFDENWKGGEHPDDVEKHWGLFRADRTPKKAMNGGS